MTWEDRRINVLERKTSDDQRRIEALEKKLSESVPIERWNRLAAMAREATDDLEGWVMDRYGCWTEGLQEFRTKLEDLIGGAPDPVRDYYEGLFQQ